MIAAFGEYGPSDRPYTSYKFVEERLRGIFGEKADEALRLLLVEFEISPDLDANFQRLIPLAKREAERLLDVRISAEGTGASTPSGG